eukprot:COSAG02_NODE_9649_length_2151_cov_11.023556_2_plen_67_part_00
MWVPSLALELYVQLLLCLGSCDTRIGDATGVYVYQNACTECQYSHHSMGRRKNPHGELTEGTSNRK